MVRLQFSIALQYDIDAPGCDFILNIHAARTDHQIVVQESLGISQPLAPQYYTDPVTHNRYLRLQAAGGPLTVRYEATVDLDHYIAQPAQSAEVPVTQLPGEVLPYIYPSRYCQSDRLHKFAVKEFGHLWQGYSRVQAIRDWILQRVNFKSNSSTGNTTAVNKPTLVVGGLKFVSLLPVQSAGYQSNGVCAIVAP